jgi:uncharacterized protein YaaQ
LENLDIAACRSVGIRNKTYVACVVDVDVVTAVVVIVVVDYIVCGLAI